MTGPMKGFGALLVVACLAASVQAGENRCGWLQNPSPGNWWLEDAQGMWVLRSQGPEDSVDGMELIPDISEREFVRTNGYYGYACACMNVETDGESRITRILSFRQLTLAQCRDDKALPAPEK